MPNETKLDPFKPAQPQIPGVAAVMVEERAEPSSQEPAGQIPSQKNGWLIAAAVVGVLLLGGVFAWWAHRSRLPSASPNTSAEIGGAEATAPPAQVVENLPVGPGKIATTEELSKPWSARRFLFRDPLTDQTLPAMVVHLPGGEYWGLSIREPYGSCEMELVTDLQKLQTFYHFHAARPMIADPCDRSVFDLARYGTAPGGLVRGEIEQGPAIRPPIAIEIRISGNQVLAERME